LCFHDLRHPDGESGLVAGIVGGGNRRADRLRHARNRNRQGDLHGDLRPVRRVDMGVVKKPTPAELHDVAKALGLNLTDADVASYLEQMTGTIDGYNALAEMPSTLPPVKYPRTPGYFPQGEDNPNNAWYVKTTIKGAPSGKLAGKTVAVKDNVCVA